MFVFLLFFCLSPSSLSVSLLIHNSQSIVIVCYQYIYCHLSIPSKTKTIIIGLSFFCPLLDCTSFRIKFSWHDIKGLHFSLPEVIEFSGLVLTSHILEYSLCFSSQTITHTHTHTHTHTQSYTPVYLTVDIIHITGSITYSCRVFLTSFTKHLFILHSLLSSLWTSLNKLSCEGQIICYLGLQAKISNFFPRKANSLFKFHTLYLKM